MQKQVEEGHDRGLARRAELAVWDIQRGDISNLEELQEEVDVASKGVQELQQQLDALAQVVVNTSNAMRWHVPE